MSQIQGIPASEILRTWLRQMWSGDVGSANAAQGFRGSAWTGAWPTAASACRKLAEVAAITSRAPLLQQDTSKVPDCGK